ncbi:hypothetical protein PMAYCL1PPCAC_06093, partial [Pristionchus mayeri]
SIQQRHPLQKMFRNLVPLARRVVTRAYNTPVLAVHHGSLGYVKEAHNGALGGYPEEQPEMIIARVFKNAAEIQKAWRIDLDSRSSWENELIGCTASSDPMSNVAKHMKFGSKEDAISFCQENNWTVEIEGV